MLGTAFLKNYYAIFDPDLRKLGLGVQDNSTVSIIADARVPTVPRQSLPTDPQPPTIPGFLESLPKILTAFGAAGLASLVGLVIVLIFSYINDNFLSGPLFSPVNNSLSLI